MSRFSPDTWLDAVSLPFAMAQSAPNVYVETIAPDARPFFGVVLAVVFVVSYIFWKKKNDEIGDIVRVRASITTASLLSLILWISSSGNGRYGFFAFFLIAVGISTSAASFLKNKATRLYLLSIVLIAQGLMWMSSDISGGWLSLTQFRWRDSYASALDENIDVQYLKKSIVKKNSLIITSRINSGMLMLNSIFGGNPKYINLRYLNNFRKDEFYKNKTLEMIAAADVIYMTLLEPSTIAMEDGQKNKMEILDVDRDLLAQYGLSIEPHQCRKISSEMGWDMTACEVIKNGILHAKKEESFDQAAVELYKRLEAKCPAVFGSPSPMIANADGGVRLYVNDAKYFVSVTSDLNVYIKHRSEVNLRKILQPYQLVKLDQMSCFEIIGGGRQYWNKI